MEQKQEGSDQEPNHIQIIQNWLRDEAPFRGKTDSIFITNFLNACADDVEETKEKIAKYYTIRKRYPKTMKNRDFLEPNILKMFNQSFIVSNEFECDSKYTFVAVVKFSRLQPDDDILSAIRLATIMIESQLYQDSRLSKYGSNLVYDFENLPFWLIMQFNPSVLQETISCILEALPHNLNSFHIINAGMIMSAVIKLIRLLFPAHLKHVIHVHSGSWECLKGHLPPECLPIEYGGSNVTLAENLELLRESLMKSRDYLIEGEEYGFADEEHKE